LLEELDVLRFTNKKNFFFFFFLLTSFYPPPPPETLLILRVSLLSHFTFATVLHHSTVASMPPRSGRTRTGRRYINNAPHQPYTRGRGGFSIRTLGNQAINYGAHAAGTYLGIPSGVTAAGLAGARAISRSVSKRGRSAPRARGQGKIYSGKYAGKFKKSTKKLDPWAIYTNTGVQNTTEVHGLIADPDCIYIGHSAMSIIQAYEVVTQALFRKILTKVGRLNVTDIKEKIEGYHALLSDAFKLELVSVNAESGAVDLKDHTFQNVESVYTLVGDNMAGLAPSWTGFQTRLLEYMRGTNPNIVPTVLRLYRKDGNTGAFWVNAGELDLTNEKVHFKALSSIKIQNRSLSAGGSSDAQNVENNPIVGFRYGLSGGVPIVRATQGTGGNKSYLFNSIDHVTGVMLVRAAQFGSLGTVFKEPASPGVFVNCKNSNKVRLDPGAIKRSNITYEVKMGYLGFMKALSDQLQGGTKVINIPGKFELFAFEDVINVNSAETIKMAYEVDRKMGCYLTTKKRTFALGSFNSDTLSNVP